MIDFNSFFGSIIGLSIDSNLRMVSAWIVNVTLSCVGSTPNTFDIDVR